MTENRRDGFRAGREMADDLNRRPQRAALLSRVEAATLEPLNAEPWNPVTDTLSGVLADQHQGVSNHADAA